MSKFRGAMKKVYPQETGFLQEVRQESSPNRDTEDG